MNVYTHGRMIFLKSYDSHSASATSFRRARQLAGIKSAKFVMVTPFQRGRYHWYQWDSFSPAGYPVWSNANCWRKLQQQSLYACPLQLHRRAASAIVWPLKELAAMVFLFL